jgi:hypothetical protein
MALLLLSCDDNITLPTNITTSETSDIVMALNPGVDTIEVYSTYTDPGAIASLSDESITVSVLSNTVDTNQVGVYFIRYQAISDQKTSSLIRMVIVIDSTKPDLALEKGIDTILINDEWIDAGVSASDNYDNDLDISVEGSVDTTSVGTYIIIYTATDDYGNTSSITRIVDVIE